MSTRVRVLSRIGSVPRRHGSTRFRYRVQGFAERCLLSRWSLAGLPRQLPQSPVSCREEKSVANTEGIPQRGGWCRCHPCGWRLSVWRRGSRRGIRTAVDRVRVRRPSRLRGPRCTGRRDQHADEIHVVRCERHHDGCLRGTAETWYDPVQGLRTEVTKDGQFIGEMICRDGTSAISMSLLPGGRPDGAHEFRRAAQPDCTTLFTIPISPLRRDYSGETTVNGIPSVAVSAETPQRALRSESPRTESPISSAWNHAVRARRASPTTTGSASRSPFRRCLRESADRHGGVGRENRAYCGGRPVGDCPTGDAGWRLRTWRRMPPAARPTAARTAKTTAMAPKPRSSTQPLTVLWTS